MRLVYVYGLLDRVCAVVLPHSAVVENKNFVSCCPVGESSVDEVIKIRTPAHLASRCQRLTSHPAGERASAEDARARVVPVPSRDPGGQVNAKYENQK